ncbi:peptidoglycan DD-metalloendopeptidase family protein [Paenibacillus sp. GCM10012307]|uniref:M23 family metallopeptidase n=1 Tax=Paenibacillus roseus TaxID=2798579 RepID=A0A934J949_9BACL|nr:M23 family metallopeptidase [Paenibacillus roseus]MBJ6362931.1 M23 family metallopeptidase [Paenibacillus roseus]
MEIKDAIRQRRQERMRNIQQTDMTGGGPAGIKPHNEKWKSKDGQRAVHSSRPAVHSTEEHRHSANNGVSPEPKPDQNILSSADGENVRDPERMWKSKGGGWRNWEVTPRTYEMPSTAGGGPPNDVGPNYSILRKELLMKLMLSLILFAGVWGMFHLDRPWAIEGQRLVRDALTQDMNFEAVAVWYENTFSGSPAFIPIFGDRQPQAQKASGSIKESTVLPVADGIIVRSFAELLNGVEIASSSEGGAVYAAQTGRVLLVSGNGPEHTVVIQHSGKRVTIYGQLSEISVAQNDWVEAGDTIGSVKPGTAESSSLLFFAVKENDHYVDPAEVIAFE